MVVESAVATRSKRPAVLIGHGAFGRSALERLLSSAALRGRLEWRAGDGGDDERRLRDLGVLWWPDGEVEEASPDGSSGLELMRDVSRQIERIDAADRDLSEVVDRVASRLLAAADRLGRDDSLPLGLDVIVLARPGSRETVGRLDRVLEPVLDGLSAKKVLRRGVQGADKLGFIQILDFEDYWHPGEGARGVREALASSAARWRARAIRKEPSFSRLYLIDGQTEDGVKFAKDRLDEVVLFLELLLFEGLRDSTLQRLYQRQRDDEAPAATFGVRVFERSPALLQRLAAASFALRWLEHLDAASPTEDAPSAVDELLAPLAGRGLARTLRFDQLETHVDAAFEALEKELLSIPAQRPDWADQVAARYRTVAARLEADLDGKLTGLLAEKSPWLDDLPAALGRAVDSDLGVHADGVPRTVRPRSAATLLQTLASWRSRIAPVPEARSDAGEGASRVFSGLRRLGASFQSFCRDQVEASRLRAFWPLWAAALALVGAPPLLELLEGIPAPDPNDAHHLLVEAHGLFARSLSAFSVSLGLAFLTLAVGLLVAQPRLRQGARRGRLFYDDKERGRLADRLRRELDVDGGLRGPVAERLRASAADREAGVRGRLVREVDRLTRQLQERRREMGWLRDQLAELLRVHGLGGEERRGDLEPLRQGSGVRSTSERVGDVRRWVSSNPPGAERFHSMQSSEGPFERWRDPDAGVFLRPLEFLDDLSRRFHDPESTEPGSLAASSSLDALLSFIDRHHNFDLSFPWLGSDGVPGGETLCLLAPEVAVDEVGRTLRGAGIAEERWHAISGGSRVYLLRLQVGVAADRLAPGSPAPGSPAPGSPP